MEAHFASLPPGLRSREYVLMRLLLRGPLSSAVLVLAQLRTVSIREVRGAIGEPPGALTLSCRTGTAAVEVRGPKSDTQIRGAALLSRMRAPDSGTAFA